MAHGMRRLAELPPDARRQVLAGQTHMVKATAVAPALKRFFVSA